MSSLKFRPLRRRCLGLTLASPLTPSQFRQAWATGMSIHVTSHPWTRERWSAEAASEEPVWAEALGSLVPGAPLLAPPTIDGLMGLSGDQVKPVVALIPKRFRPSGHLDLDQEGGPGPWLVTLLGPLCLSRAGPGRTLPERYDVFAFRDWEQVAHPGCAVTAQQSAELLTAQVGVGDDRGGELPAAGVLAGLLGAAKQPVQVHVDW